VKVEIRVNKSVGHTKDVLENNLCFGCGEWNESGSHLFLTCNLVV